MPNILEHDGQDENAILIGGVQNDSQISLKTYQDLYHQITGKTEEIRKRYFDSICIDFSDIEQLHFKITQLCDVHNIVANTEMVSIYYDEERKEQFTSFDRFKHYNANSTSPVNNFVLKYNFSIVPAKLKKPQEYTITIRLTSRIALVKELRDGVPFPIPGSLISMVSSQTAEIRVEYVDYVIARGFIEAFQEWMSGCEKSKEPKVITFGKKHSHLLPPFGKILISILYGYFIYQSVDYILPQQTDFIAFAKFLVLNSVIFVVALNLSIQIFKAIENSIDNFMSVSYVNLNKGDQRMIEFHANNQRKNLISFISSSLMAIILGVISSQIYELLKWLS